MVIGIDARLWSETGVGRYTRNLVTNLQQIDKKNEYILFVIDKDYTSVKGQVSQNKNWRVVLANIRWHSIEEQVKLPVLLKKYHLDIMHFPYFSVPIFYPGRYIITVHDLILHHFETGEASTLPWPMYVAKRIAYKGIIARAAKNAEKIIAVSEATKKEIVNHLHVDASKVVVTYEGLSLLEMRKEIPDLFTAKNYFLHVGNVYPHKNVDRLLQAFFKVVEKKNNCMLVFVGKEDYFLKKVKIKVAQSPYANNIIFLHTITDNELAYIYRNACATVVPSLMEGFGLPALEALGYECLVLAADIPSLKEVCRDAAIYFDPYNIDDIAVKLQAALALSQKEKNVLLGKGLQRSKEFSWENMAKETRDIYESSISIRQS